MDAIAIMFAILAVIAFISVLVLDWIEDRVNNKLKTRNLLSLKVEFDITEEEQEMLRDIMTMEHYDKESKYFRECLFHESNK